MEDLILELVMWLIRLAGLAVGALLIPYIRSKTTEVKYQQILDNVTWAVEAAQQLYKVFGPEFDRKDYALQLLKQLKFNISEDQLDTLIESAVFQLNLIMEEARRDTEISTGS